MTGADRFSVRKVVNRMSLRIVRRLLPLLLLVLPVLSGCGNKADQLAVPNQRPIIGISNAPIQGTEEFYSIRINWFASDSDGQVTRYIYATDPPVMGDTTWTSTTSSEVTVFFRSPNPNDPLPPLGSVIISRGYHTFVVKAIDNEGAASAPASRSFTSRTTAPSTNISAPRPTHQQPISTTPSVTINWLGTDPDGVLSQKPIKYKFKIVSATDISPGNPTGITAQQIQDYFGKDADNFFASWDSVSGDTTSVFFEGLTPQTVYYFAIVAFDEAGAFEPRFTLDSNVLQFRPTLDKLGPDITVFNEFFSKTQSTGGISPAASRIYPFEFPSDSPIRLNWIAVADIGALVTGYRWAVDIEGADIGNETPRTDDSDVHHWSTWSLNEVSATIGPFTGSVDSTVTHFFYLEARDNLGFVSLFTIRLKIVKPRFDKSLLVIDDMYGTATGMRPDSTINYVGGYPMEAEQDSFYYSVGGFPDVLKRHGVPGADPSAISKPGVFAGFDYDTLDYKFYPNEGVLLEDLARYKVVTWYTDGTSASRAGAKFSNTPMTGIRYINSVNRLNTLAVYLKQLGKVWLLGDGTTTAIANGYWSRFSNNAAARIPYTSGETNADILKLGNFLYDFPHLRSQLITGGLASSPALTQNQQLRACIPYLPQFAGPATNTDRSHDPRIGPSAARNLPQWDGLPQLTLAAFRGANVDPNLRSVSLTWCINQPLFVTEGTGQDFQSTLDTLYLFQARTLDLNHVQVPPSDGFPNAVYYHGADSGPVVWFGFPLYYFELDQARACAEVVLRNFGLTPKASPSGAGAFVSVKNGARSTQPVAANDTRRSR